MILITTIAQSIIVSFDHIVEKPVAISIKGIDFDKTFKISQSDFLNVPIPKKGKFKVSVKQNSTVYSKTVFIL